MDINYILGREQMSLHNAQVAPSSSARASNRGLAAAYGQLLADGDFPHRSPLQLRFRSVDEGSADDWDDDGLTDLTKDIAVPSGLDTVRNPYSEPSNSPTAFNTDDSDKSFSALVRAVECNERLLALQYSAGTVSPKSFANRSRFQRQDRDHLAMMSQFKLPGVAS